MYSETTALTTSGNLIAASMLSGEVLMWHNDSATEAETAQPLGMWQLSKSPINSIAIADTWLVAATHDGKLLRTLIPQMQRDSTLLATPEPAWLAGGNRHSQSVTWLPDGQSVLVSSYNGELSLIDLAACGQPVKTTNDPVLTQICSRQHIPIGSHPSQKKLIVGAPPTKPLQRRWPAFQTLPPISAPGCTLGNLR